MLEMVLPDLLPDWPFSNIHKSQWLAIASATILAYSMGRGIYNLYFHPISKYPGPKLAAVSNVWYAYNWLTGRWPWKIEDVLSKYGKTAQLQVLVKRLALTMAFASGDVVRIAPNELVFMAPQAARDIYLSTREKNLESFTKTDFEDLGEGDGGISAEVDPVKHREVAKRLAPAFSMKNFKAKEATLESHIDLFVAKMREVGGGEKGAEMRRWADWLSMDISADMTYNRQMNQMRDMKNSIFLNAAINVNLFGTINQIMKKFPLLSPLMYLFIPPSVWLTMPRVMKINSQEVQTRIQHRGKTGHLDYFEQMIPPDAPVPKDKKHITHLEQIAGQLLVAGWEPVSNQFYSSIFFLLKEPEAHRTLVDEVRRAFEAHDEITVDSVGDLKYLQASLHETFRLHHNTADGLPRMSPGAMVDGVYVPGGVTCQISYFAAARSPRFFAEPLEFRPRRWLSTGHPHYDARFKHDNLKAFMPFGQGPRGCPGSAIAWAQTRLFLAKVLWSFDLEVVEGGRDLSFDKDFTFYSMWDKPEFWVRFNPVSRE